MALSDDEILREAGRIRARRRLRVAKTCAVCGKPFEGIAQARYCSDACRMAAARERKARHDVDPDDIVYIEPHRPGESTRDYIIRGRREAIERGEMSPDKAELSAWDEEQIALIDEMEADRDELFREHGLFDDSTEIIRRSREERSKQLSGQ